MSGAAMDRGAAMALALEWAQRGVPAFPIAVEWDDEKGKTNKRPLTAHGFEDASTDARAIRGMFNKSGWSGTWGVGLRPGPAGFLAVDVDGQGDVERWEARDLPATYAPTTASGSRHYWFRKLTREHVGTRCEWPEVDVIRADDGFIVAPGTTSPWGDWTTFDEFPADVADCPPELWEAIQHGSASGGAGSAGVDTQGLELVVAKLRHAHRHQDADVLAVLATEHGAHHPFMRSDGSVYVTRPGKHSGTSASVGYVAPGVVKMFSGNWPPFEKEGRYTLDDDGARLASDSDTATEQAATATEPTADAPKRRVHATALAGIRPRRVRWLWEQRLPLGSLSLLAGPEGLGKSTVAYWTAARITRGELPGEHDEQPRAALICATEDSYAHTIVPRLMAHGADLALVYRLDVVLDGALHAELNLPADIADVEQIAADTGAVLLVLDPLMSRLDSRLDTHRDGEVRRALEPLAAMCDAAGLSALGIIHHNKGGSTDPLDRVMASKAFTAVARSVQTVIRDPDDDTGARRLFGTPKNNLGRGDLPVLTFTIDSYTYDTDDGPGSTGQIAWGDNATGSIADALARGARDPDKRTAETDAVAWLRHYMSEHAHQVLDLEGAFGVEAADVLAAAEANGHPRTTIQRAKTKLGIGAEKGRGTFKNRWFWVVPPDEDSTKVPGDTLMESSVSKGCEAPGRGEDTEDSKIPVLGDTWNLREHRCTDPFCEHDDETCADFIGAAS